MSKNDHLDYKSHARPFLVRPVLSPAILQTIRRIQKLTRPIRLARIQLLGPPPPRKDPPVFMVADDVVSIFEYEVEIPKVRYARRVMKALVEEQGGWVRLRSLIEAHENKDGPRNAIKQLRRTFGKAIETRPGRKGAARLDLDRLRHLYGV